MKKIVTIAAIAATLVSCSGGGGRPTFGDNEYPVVTVGTSQADMQTTYPASIKGVQDVEIRPKAQGFLTQINVKEGQTVSAGQVLFVIDNETYQAQVRQAQAAVNAAPMPSSCTRRRSLVTTSCRPLRILSRAPRHSWLRHRLRWPMRRRC